MAAASAVAEGPVTARTFPKGGVHPHDFKEYTRDRRIRNAPIPSVAIVPMSQHMGKPARCIVSAGDEVREEMLIGEADGMFSANVHSPVPGKVSEIREVYLPNGIRSEAVVIELEGEFDRSGKGEERMDWSGLTGQDLLGKIAEKGIVGLGGATFPTKIKYFIREGLSVETLVVNGVECEPYLTGDHRLMLERTGELLEGAAIVERILEPDRVVFAVEQNKPDAIAALSREIAGRGLAYEVAPLRVKYPQGDEKQLLKALIGREVPSGGLPIDIGAVVSNVGTVNAIFEAIVWNKPLIERIVTVTGSCIADPGNYKVRIGTRFRDLIEECGGFTEPPAKVVAGGPMMGFAVSDIDMPITKGVSGILAISKREAGQGDQTTCIRCGRCIAHCPFGLDPTRLYKLIDHQEYQAALDAGLMDCKECGCCSFVCPAGIYLTQGLKLGKLLARKIKRKAS
jgi:electron transport complex protein RnfC